MELPESAPSNKLKTWLFNPFYYIAGGTALGVGLAVMVIASLVGAATNYHFDGVIDLHSGTPAPAWVFVAENLINWLVMGVLVYLAGRLISRSRIRPLDVFGTQALARAPMAITLFCVLLPGFRRVTDHLAGQLIQGSTRFESGTSGSDLISFSQVEALDLAVFVLAVVLALLLLVWTVLLMYRAFAVSCNVGGGKAIGVFTVVILLGEVLSKVFIGALLAAIQV
ncbi:MAG: hypothetical protein OYM47_12145 [Gemmatimonadota bacterium]|nr:hypothetical protein [Gemmatimonadota bacterium]